MAHWTWTAGMGMMERLRDKEPRLDDEWLRAVCWFNGKRLLGV